MLLYDFYLSNTILYLIHLLFSLKGGEAEDVRLYKDIGGFEETKKIFSGVLELYNQENKAMTLVLFEMAIDHLCRIHRIIRNPRG